MATKKIEIRDKASNYVDVLYPKTSIDMVDGLQTVLNGKSNNHDHPYAATGHTHTANAVGALPIGGGQLTGKITNSSGYWAFGTSDQVAQLPNGTNLNDVTASNVYRVTDPKNAPTISNGWCYIEVFKHADTYIFQRLSDLHTGRQWYRTLRGTTWSYWQTIISADPTGLTENINNMSIPAIYSQPLTANATTANGYPVAEAGSLVILNGPYGPMQEYTTYKTGKKFTRGLAGSWTGNGPWNPWVELARQSDVNDLKSSVSSGKNAVASAITAKGVTATGSDDFATLANKINQIGSVASKYNLYKKIIQYYASSYTSSYSKTPPGMRGVSVPPSGVTLKKGFVSWYEGSSGNLGYVKISGNYSHVNIGTADNYGSRFIEITGTATLTASSTYTYTVQYIDEAGINAYMI